MCLATVLFRQRRANGFHRIVAPVALRLAPLHNGRDSAPDPPGRFRLACPNRQKDAHDIGSNRLGPSAPSALAQQAQGVVPEHETFLCGRQLRFPQAAQYEGRRDKVEIGAEDDALGAHRIES